jgi:glycosyltransferase involved in cell wall biosynthesis
MVVPQAMGCGLPVIVTENVGAADIVKDGENGFIIPIRDVDALKEKLIFLYENQTDCQEMGKLAHESVRSGCTWDDYGDRLIDFLYSISLSRV